MYLYVTFIFQNKPTLSSFNIPFEICDESTKKRVTTKTISGLEHRIPVAIEGSKTTKDEIEETFIPLTLKGSILQDNFFDNCRNKFMSNVSDIIKKSDSASELSESSDSLSSYRKIRKQTPKEDNLASAITEDDTSYKVSL